MYLCVDTSVFMFISLSVHPYVAISVCLCAYVATHPGDVSLYPCIIIPLSTSISAQSCRSSYIHIFVCICVCLCACACICPCVCLRTCIFMCPCFCICICICLHHMRTREQMDRVVSMTATLGKRARCNGDTRNETRPWILRHVAHDPARAYQASPNCKEDRPFQVRGGLFVFVRVYSAVFWGHTSIPSTFLDAFGSQPSACGLLCEACQGTTCRPCIEEVMLRTSAMLLFRRPSLRGCSGHVQFAFVPITARASCSSS